MLANGVDPAATAVAVLVQRLIPAVAAGGALSATNAGPIVLTAAWGLGPAVAQGEVVPDRYVLRRDGPVLEDVEPGRKSRMLTCSPGGDLRWRPVTPALHSTPCLDEAQALALARLVLTAEAALDAPVEIEWALDAEGFHLLQARPAPAQATRAAGPAAVDGPRLAGQPAAAGWAVGPARLVRTEAELDRVRPGDVLVTRVPGPALAAVLPRVVAVVAELGGSTSHLAALARERRIPAVLGIGDATRRIPEGARVVVDGTLGVVHVERTDSRRH
jgi:pyruvate,water dikinase